MSISEARRTTTGQHPDEPDPARSGARLAPFVAWLATQLDDERTRRHYREVVTDFLVWAEHDRGDPRTRYGRYCRQSVAVAAPDVVREALDRLLEHDAVVAATLPLDG